MKVVIPHREIWHLIGRALWFWLMGKDIIIYTRAGAKF